MKKFTRIGEITSLLALALAALVIWSWGAGAGDLFASRSQYVPMAPGTALLMLLLGMGVFLSSRWGGSRVAQQILKGMAGFALGAGLLVLLRAWLNWNSPIEVWLSQTTDSIAGIPVGQMSPLTGAVFVAIGLAMLLGGALPRIDGFRMHAARCCAAIAILTGLVVALSYLAGRPLLYGGEVIPMALWTAVSFILLGIGVLGGVLQTGPGPAGPEAGRRAVMPLVAFGVVALTIGAAGAGAVRHLQKVDRENARAMLRTVCDMKAGQLADWRQRRLEDAQFYGSEAYLARDVEAYLSSPTFAAEAELEKWLKLIKGGDRYAQVTLFDPNLTPRLSVPAPFPRQAPHQDLMREIMRTGKIAATDLHEGPEHGAVRMAILFPVFVPGADVPTPLGVILLHINPHQLLFPMLKDWPAPSRTAETLLLRREGDEVVLLNELNHTTNVFLAKRPLPEALRLTDNSGSSEVAEGRGFRDVPVVAAAVSIPASPWFLVAQVDRDEILAPTRRLALLAVALTAVMVTAAGLLIWLVWKHHLMTNARRELLEERGRRALNERVNLLMRSANDIIFMADEQWRILEANDRAVECYGYSLAELLSMKLGDLRAPDHREEFVRQYAQLKSAGFARFESLNQRQDGTCFPVEISGRMVEAAGDRYYLCIAHDITHRRAQEREIMRLTRFYATLSQINRAIVQQPSREDLFREICRIAVESAGLNLAWVGWIEQESGRIRVAARAGSAEGWLDAAPLFVEERPGGLAPVSRCVREGVVCLSTDMAAWCESAGLPQLYSLVALPLWVNKTVAGVLVVHAAEKEFFSDREIVLLEESALDISYALNHLEHEAERHSAELALRTSEARFRSYVENSPAAILVTDDAGRFVEANPAASELLGYEVSLLLKLSIVDVLPEEDCAVALMEFKTLVRDGQKRGEYRVRRRDGSLVWVALRAVKIAEGRFMAYCHDISERRQAMESLQQRVELQDQLAKIASTVPGMIFSFKLRPDGSWFMPYASPALGSIFGLTPEAVGKDAGPAMDRIHPDDIVRVRETIVDSARAMKPWQTHFRVRHPAKGELWVEGHSVPQLEPDGSVLWHGFVEDITERKRADEQLRENEEQYRTLVSASPDAIIVTDPYGIVVYFSPRVLDVFGHASTDDLCDQNVRQWMAPEEAGKFESNLRCLLAEGHIRDSEYTMVKNDGMRFHGEINAALLRTSDGQPKGMILITRDITERRRAEADQKRLATAVEQSAETIVVTDQHGSIVYANPAFERTTGFTVAEVLNKNPRVLKSGQQDASFYQRMWEALNRGEVWMGRFINKRKDGSLFEEEATISPVRDGAGQIVNFVAVKRNVTREVALETQLRQSQKMEAIGQLAGGVAHDFNNILAATMMQLGLMQQKTDLSPEHRQSLKELMSHAERAAGLTRQLLLFSRRSVIQVRPTDFNEVVEALLKMLRRLIGEHIRLDWQGQTGLPQVRGDAGMLDQVLMNLVVNARDAMPEGGRLTLATRTVAISPEQAKADPDASPGHYVCLSVTDTGCGMDESVRARIFEPFFTTKEAGKGTGLGLATVYGIVQQHRGWIKVESQPGLGSTFHVFLPAEAHGAVAVQASSKAGPLQGGLETIFVVEDDAAVRRTVCTFLRRWGYRVIEAGNGVEALGLWPEHQLEIDLLLTDMVMPEGVTGLELAQRLRISRPELKVIVTSGYSSDLLNRSGAASAGITYVPKPCLPAELAAAIRRNLDEAADAVENAGCAS